MEINSEAVIHHPRDKAFLAYRDRLVDIVPYIPDIKEIKVLKREEQDGIVKLHNEWASEKEIPKAARAVLRPEHLRWDDYASWNEAEWTCDWKIETRVFKDAVYCKGRNTFSEVPEGTRIKLTGDFTIDLKTVPGVPGFLGKRIAPMLEKFIVSLITPNLVQVNKSLEKFLDEQG